MKTSVLIFLFFILQSCASISKKNPEINLNKELKKHTISFGEYLGKITPQKPSFTESLNERGHTESIKLDNKSIEFLQLTSADTKAKKFYFEHKVELSKNYTSIVVSVRKADRTSTYLVNYDNEYHIIDSLLIFLEYDNHFFITSQFYGNKISIMEAFADQGQAIIQSWDTKITDNGRFSHN